MSESPPPEPAEPEVNDDKDVHLPSPPPEPYQQQPTSPIMESLQPKTSENIGVDTVASPRDETLEHQDGPAAVAGVSGTDEDEDKSNLLFIPRPFPPPDERKTLDAELRKRPQPPPLQYDRTTTSEKIDRHGDFLRFLCDRIASLEQEVESIRGEQPQAALQTTSPARPFDSAPPSPPRSPPPPSNGPSSVEVPPASPGPAGEPHPLPMIEYGDTKWFLRRLDVPDAARFIIEVEMLPDTDRSLTQEYINENPGLAHVTPSDEKVPGVVNRTSDSLKGSTILLPRRVRIRSNFIQKYLGWDRMGAPVLFLSPFKLFVKDEERLRETICGLEKKIQEINKDESAARLQNQTDRGQLNLVTGNPETESKAEDTTEPVINDTDAGNPSNGPTDAPNANSQDRSPERDAEESENDSIRNACEHLRLLLQLFDGALKPFLEQRHKIKSGKASTIAFGHLWYLFEHGQDVIHQSEPPQVSRVLCFTGGREINTTSTRSSSAYSQPSRPAPGTPYVFVQTNFVVDCYRWEFDGERYRPVVDCIAIKPYAGVKDIASLPLYPSSFDKRGETFTQALLNRGQTFLSLTRKNTVVHRYYSGLSLDSELTNCEEV